MAFIFVFIILALIFPLCVEIYRRGYDNIIVRSGKELANLDVILSAHPTLRGIVLSTSSRLRYVSMYFREIIYGLLAILIFIALVFISLGIVMLILRLLWSGIR